VNNRAKGNYIAHKRQQAGTGSIGYVAHSYTAKTGGVLDLYGNCHDTFSSTTASFATLLDAADKGFINFNVARKLFAFGIDHGHTKSL
jgi:hypothetical protein